MSRWPITPLKGHIAEVSIRKGETPAEVLSVTNTAGFVRSLDVFDKQVFSQDASNYKLVRFNDLAYNPSRINVGSVARCQFPEGGAVSPMYVVVRCKDSLLPQFLLYFLKSDIGQQNIVHRCVGAVRFMLRFGDLEQIELPLPPLAEQERTVRILDEADALRRLRAQASGRIEQLASALFHEMLANASDVTEVPLEALLSRIDSGWSPVCHDEPAQPEQWGVLKLGAVTSGRFIEAENKALRPEERAREQLEVKAGDVLFTRKNTKDLIAATAYVWEARPRLMMSDLIFRLVPSNSGQLNPIYLTYALKEPNKRREVQSLASGAAGSMPNISKGRLLSIRIPLVSPALQEEFAAHVAEIHQLEAAQAASRQRIADLFQSLLHRAFQGEL
ncbi:MAG: restriction endonuclease subunit S [Gammaproteobacteria bacterium]|nr:restriction endonuclease subunit S [Gammaproteobacteria bacterium]